MSNCTHKLASAWVEVRSLNTSPITTRKSVYTAYSFLAPKFWL
ncbi:hypothetical protein [Nostoc sp. 'Lobaria pulmonaria (5183) cyanobiont']|nr:hypothetical protein [Nostoc sp. 'Lobaria pulmonaria (5183) cyanobiont']